MKTLFDLERAIRDWRKRTEHTSFLSPGEVDELEDHVRARVDLELEMDQALIPERAFRIASKGLGAPATLSKEFAKAGMPRWRKLLVTGWALFAISFFLPLWTKSAWPYLGDPQTLPGWRALLLFLDGRGPFETVSALTNLLMLATLLRGRRVPSMLDRALPSLLLGSAAYNACHWIVWVAAGASPWAMGIGYWAWAGSFACVAAGLRLRVGGRASAQAGSRNALAAPTTHTTSSSITRANLPPRS